MFLGPTGLLRPTPLQHNWWVPNPLRNTFHALMHGRGGEVGQPVQQATGEQATGEQATGEQATHEQATSEQAAGEQATIEQATGEQANGATGNR